MALATSAQGLLNTGGPGCPQSPTMSMREGGRGCTNYVNLESGQPLVVGTIDGTIYGYSPDSHEIVYDYQLEITVSSGQNSFTYIIPDDFDITIGSDGNFATFNFEHDLIIPAAYLLNIISCNSSVDIPISIDIALVYASSDNVAPDPNEFNYHLCTEASFSVQRNVCCNRPDLVIDAPSLDPDIIIEYGEDIFPQLSGTIADRDRVKKELLPDSNIPVIKVYPNPFQDQITLDLQLTQPETVAVQLTALSGKVVQRVQQRMEAGQKRLHLALDALPPGIYLAQLHTSASTQSVKLLKTK